MRFLGLILSLTLTHFVLAADEGPLFPSVGPSRFEKLGNIFSKGTLPALAEENGWWSGRCYTEASPDNVSPALLVIFSRPGIAPATSPVVSFYLTALSFNDRPDSLDSGKISSDFVESIKKQLQRESVDNDYWSHRIIFSPAKSNGNYWEATEYNAYFVKVGKGASYEQWQEVQLTGSAPYLVVERNWTSRGQFPESETEKSTIKRGKDRCYFFERVTEVKTSIPQPPVERGLKP